MLKTCNPIRCSALGCSTPTTVVDFRPWGAQNLQLSSIFGPGSPKSAPRRPKTRRDGPKTAPRRPHQGRAAAPQQLVQTTSPPWPQAQRDALNRSKPTTVVNFRLSLKTDIINNGKPCSEPSDFPRFRMASAECAKRKQSGHPPSGAVTKLQTWRLLRRPTTAPGTAQADPRSDNNYVACDPNLLACLLAFPGQASKQVKFPP